MSINTVPADILLEIADYLSCPSEVLHLYLTSSRIADALTPALYSRIVLRGSAQCIRTLDMLSKCPARARHVRALSVFPDYSSLSSSSPSSPSSSFAEENVGRRGSGWGRGVLPDGYAVSSAVRRAARRLEVLNYFLWDGEELPPYDDMWFALRISCPHLRFISTTLGSILPSPNSHLFDFTDLHGFSLTFKSGFYWQNDGVSRDEPVPGYHRLWDMLIKRCPNLEHLAIDGYSPHAPVDAPGLVRGRWPKLRSLLIGDVVLDWHVELNPALGRPFRAFLEAHRTLEQLHLHSHAPSVAAPSVLTDLHPDALAKVSTFSGALAQAQVLPQRATLKTLRVPDALVLREGTSLSVSAALTVLPALASLTIAFRLEQGYENGSVLRAVVAACPHLRHLDFTVTCRPSFTIEAFTRHIRPLGQLRTLALRIVPSPGEDSLPTCGARLVRASPRLTTFEIAFLARALPGTVRVRAKFALATDAHGLPLALHVVECRLRRPRWFWSLLHNYNWLGTWSLPTESVRRITLDMRPAGAPGTRRAPLLALALERSPAGEEMRLLLFCATLLVIVVWGCVRL